MRHIATLLWTCVLPELADPSQSSGQAHLIHLHVPSLRKRLLQGIYLGAQLRHLIVLPCIGSRCRCDAAGAGMAFLCACTCRI